MDTLASILEVLEAVQRPPGVPATAVPFTSTNQTAITTTTAVDIKAAVASKRHWITAIHATNSTASEQTAIVLKDNAGSPKILGTIIAEAEKGASLNLKIPIEVASGLKITGEAQEATVGDTFVTIEGYVEA
jgi:hypothetical protein